MIWAYAIIGFIALQRLAEVIYAQRNTGALLARGATEIGASHYPVMIALHATWLAAIFLALPKPTSIHWIALAAMIVLQAARVWIIATLGPYWTTRIINLPGAPLVRKGPYRFFRHPNYMIVVGEIAALPLVFGEIWVAAVFSVLNAAMLFWRIREEDAALGPRRAMPANES
ncbi:MAG TPA: isoprenylcysteine carboxylmethyltransferase family protein [Rhizomicrobium sp.]|jgi:methyltransferase|nr:isoprenylcysteine carboxylmethyltransferase family protein [Rhizomicrobium sp.]